MFLDKMDETTLEHIIANGNIRNQMAKQACDAIGLKPLPQPASNAEAAAPSRPQHNSNQTGGGGGGGIDSNAIMTQQMQMMMEMLKGMQTKMEMGFREGSQNHEALQKTVGDLTDRLEQTEDTVRRNLHGSGNGSSGGSEHGGYHTEEDEDQYHAQMNMRWRKTGEGMYSQNAYPTA